METERMSDEYESEKRRNLTDVKRRRKKKKNWL